MFFECWHMVPVPLYTVLKFSTEFILWYTLMVTLKGCLYTIYYFDLHIQLFYLQVARKFHLDLLITTWTFCMLNKNVSLLIHHFFFNLVFTQHVIALSTNLVPVDAGSNFVKLFPDKLCITFRFILSTWKND